MIRNILHYENRIDRLKTSGEMKNLNLIKKAERQKRQAAASSIKK